MTTIHDELGGRVVVELVVDLFYKRLLADPTLAPYYADVDVAQAIRAQNLFAAFAVDGLPLYDGHARNGEPRPQALTGAHFDAVAGHLAAALSDVGAQDHLVARILATVASTRADLVGQPPAT